MRKQTRIMLTLFGLTVASAILHNAVSAVFGVEEAVFFTLVSVFALGFVISVIYSLISTLRKK